VIAADWMNSGSLAGGVVALVLRVVDGHDGLWVLEGRGML